MGLRGCFRCVRGAVNMLAPIVVDRFRTTVPVVAIALKEYSLANYRCSVAIAACSSIFEKCAKTHLGLCGDTICRYLDYGAEERIQENVGPHQNSKTQSCSHVTVFSFRRS